MRSTSTRARNPRGRYEQYRKRTRGCRFFSKVLEFCRFQARDDVGSPPRKQGVEPERICDTERAIDPGRQFVRSTAIDHLPQKLAGSRIANVHRERPPSAIDAKKAF